MGMSYAWVRPVSVNHLLVPSNQSGFPVPVKVPNTADLKSVANGGTVTVNAGAGIPDIAFFSDAGLTLPLAFERTMWDPTTGSCTFYVFSSVSSTVDTVFYMGYANAAIVADPQNAPSVWDTNYKGVYHFGDGVTLNLNDSTSNANHLTSNVGGVTAAVGLVDGAASFDGATQYLTRLANSGTSAQVPVTMMGLFKATALADGIIVAEEAGTQAGIEVGGRLGGVARLAVNGTTGSAVDTVATYTTGTWHTMTGVNVSATAHTIYLDGANPITGTVNLSTPRVPSTIVIGARFTSSASNFFNGLIGEARISDIARSADWCLTEHNSLINIATFTSLGAASPMGGGSFKSAFAKNANA